MDRLPPALLAVALGDLPQVLPLRVRAWQNGDDCVDAGAVVARDQDSGGVLPDGLVLGQATPRAEEVGHGGDPCGLKRTIRGMQRNTSWSFNIRISSADVEEPTFGFPRHRHRSGHPAIASRSRAGPVGR